MTIPIKDPNSTKYPDRTFVQGHWRTDEQIERMLKYQYEWYHNKRANDPEWSERRREKQRAANLTPEQLDRRRKRDKENKKLYWQTDPMFRMKDSQRRRHRVARGRKETRLAEDQAA